MKDFFLYIRTSIETLFFPPVCGGCKKRGTALCQACFAGLRDALPIGVPHHYALYDYGNTLVQDAIWNLKYRHKKDLAKALLLYKSDMLADILGEELLSFEEEEIVVVPMPQHQKRVHERGFNQASLLAQWIASTIPESRVLELLEKTRATLPQATLHQRDARLQNVAYSMSKKEGAVIAPDTCYIIIDDVTTTGATFAEAERVLRENGATKILSLALAHGYKSSTR